MDTDKGKDTLAAMVDQLRRFDFVQFTIPDVHGIPRGRLVPSCQVERACKNGVGIFSGIQYLGPQAECPCQLPEFSTFPNGTMRPLPGTVRPLAWSSAPKRQIGHVMCAFELQAEGQGSISESCPREAVLRQLRRLEVKGLRLKSAFECEFDIFKTETMEPVGGRTNPCNNLDLIDRNLDIFTDMLRTLSESGVKVEYFAPEYQGGQYEISMVPEWGVAGADGVFILRYGVRAFCHRRGLTASFMALPFSDMDSAGFHFNHSLWTQDGSENVFLDPSTADRLSATARHWTAGLLAHGPALTALSCPTVNCYHRLHQGFAPGSLHWDLDTRTCCFRAKSVGDNVYLENRIPSSACNPYLVLAATIAAGMDGVERKLECPPPGPPAKEEGKESPMLPRSLETALNCLEQDTVLTAALGERLVKNYLTVKRDFELKHFKKVLQAGMGGKEVGQKEREYYMDVI